MPKRGLGDATVKLLHDHARARGVPLMEATRAIVATDEMKAKPRQALRDLVAAFDRWRAQKDTLPHNELAEIVLDESGYTEMWQKDRSADAAGRLENLKELVRSMEEFENLQGFLEHIALVMDAEQSDGEERVSIMTLHSAKGLEFDTVFLPGWEEGLLPHQRSLDDQGRAGLEEERRLAHVGLTRARKRAKIYFVSNRRIHGSWSSTIPSRFIDELPEAHVEVQQSKGGFGGYGGYGASRFDEMQSFGSTYATPGWQRAQARGRRGGFEDEHAGRRRSGRRIVARRRARPKRSCRRAPRSPSRASWWRNRPARCRRSRSATACSTSSSATATWSRSKATSSPSRSTRPARSGWWTASCSGREPPHFFSSISVPCWPMIFAAALANRASSQDSCTLTTTLASRTSITPLAVWPSALAWNVRRLSSHRSSEIVTRWAKCACALPKPDLIRRTASSRPSRCGMETTRGSVMRVEVGISPPN